MTKRVLSKQQMPGQLKMFMTPREIHAEYSPLDKDREVQEVYLPAGASTRAAVSAGQWSQLPRDPEVYRTGGGGRFKHVGESDEDLWQRKLDESQMSRSELARERGTDLSDPSWGPSAPQAPTYGVGSKVHGSRTDRSYDRHVESYEERKWAEHDASLYDQVYERGVEAPVSLGLNPSVVTGKKQIVGGHHRIAAATDINPNQFLPVLHFTDIHEARGVDPVTKKRVETPLPWKYT